MDDSVVFTWWRQCASHHAAPASSSKERIQIAELWRTDGETDSRTAGHSVYRAMHVRRAVKKNNSVDDMILSSYTALALPYVHGT